MDKYPIVFIINGYPGSGKDTFVEKISKVGNDTNFCNSHFFKCLQKGFGTINTSTIDPIKNVAKNLGWKGEKTPEARKFLSEMKRIVTEYNDYTSKKIISDVEAARNSSISFNDGAYSFSPNNINSFFKFLFVHCREPKEIQKIKDGIGESCYTIFIKRGDINTDNLSNDSDMYVEKYNYDYYISNNGTLEDLDRTVYNFLKEFDI